MKYILPLLLWITCCNAQEFEWAGQFGSPNNNHESDIVNDIAVDDDGNTYVLGTSQSKSFDLDPTVAGTDLVTITDNDQYYVSQVYLVKTDANGNYLWGKMFGTIRKEDKGVQLKIGSDGNVYALALIKYTDPASVNASMGNVTVFKIAPNGSILNTHEIPSNVSMAGSRYIIPTSLGLDAQNNIYIAGNYYGENPVPNSGGLTIGTGFNEGGFALKLNNTGVCQWTNVFDAEDLLFLQSRPVRLLVRPDGNINITYQESEHIKLLNINATDGITLWQKTLENQRIESAGLSQNEIIITAHRYFTFPTVDVDPSPAVHTTNANTYFIILDMSGNFVSVKEYYTSGLFSLGMATIATDENNKLYISGHFEDTIDFDPSTNTHNISPPTSSIFDNEAYCMVFDENREFENVIHFGQEVPDINNNTLYLIRVAANVIKNGNLYIGGYFQGQCDFDLSVTANYNLTTMLGTSTVNSDGYLLKLANCSLTAPAAPVNQSFCMGSNPTVGNLSPGSSSIKWYNSATSNVQIPSTTPLLNGNVYYAARQNGNCPESNRLAVTVTFTPVPQPPVALNQVFCESENAKISNLVATGQNLKWYQSNNSITPITTNTALLNNTTYYVSQSVNGCESLRTPVHVTINSTAITVVLPIQNFCIRQNPTLNSIAITGQNIKWYDSALGGNLLSASLALTNQTTYYASQTINGCESLRTPVLVNIQNTPAPAALPTQAFCELLNPDLSNIVVTGSTIIWYDSSMGSNIVPVATPLVNNKTYYATQTVNGCESSNRVAVTVSLIQSLNVTDYVTYVCDEYNDNSENINPDNYNTYLINDASNYTFEYYRTLLAAENQDSTQIVATTYRLTSGLNTLYARVSSNIGCFAIAILNVTLVNEPEIVLAENIWVCEKENIVVNAGPGFDSYEWSNGSTATETTIHTPGNYWVKVTQLHDNVICSQTKNFTVTLSGKATITSIETYDWTTNQNTVKINTSGNGNYTYSIDGEHYQQSNTFTGLESGLYNVYVKDINGCGITRKEIYLLNYPPYFTPNNDGVNDAWFIKFSAKEYGLQTRIFDRYGKLIKELNKGQAWDGTFNGQNLPSSDYWFTVTRLNGKQHKGHFSLIR